MANKVVGFLLEVAMLAAFLCWGFQQVVPWNLILGLGVPAAVVVLWGAFLAPRSSRRLPEITASWASLGLFLAAAAALAGAGLTGWGIAMALLSIAHFAAAHWFSGTSQG